MVLGESGAEDLILPVGVSSFVIQYSTHLFDLGPESGGIVHRQFAGDLRQAQRCCVIHGGSPCLALFGGDEDHTIGASRTINGGGGRILQHVHRLDIGGVDEVKRITVTGAGVVEGDAIHNKQWGASRTDTTRTTNGDAVVGTGFTAGGYDVHTCDLTLDQLLRVVDDASVEGFGFNAFNSTGHITLRLRTVTHHYDLGKVG